MNRSFHLSLVLPALVTLLLLSTLNSQLSTLLAQGSAFTYQGRLSATGQPANGVYDLRFRLSSDSLGNNYVGGAFLLGGQSISNGLFTVTLDFGQGIFTGTNLWLQVDVRTNGLGSYTSLIPLQPLTPTPYAIMAETASNLSGTLPAGQLSGTLPSAQLGGTYSGAVTFNNAASTFNGAFTGNGAGLTNVNAATLGGSNNSGFWKTGGNAGTTPGVNFIGTTDNQPLELKVNGSRALRLEPNTNGAPNVIGGSPINFASPGILGATIGGGGAVNFGNASYSNKVSAHFATIGGGNMNTSSGGNATVAGGTVNTANGAVATVGGGQENTSSGQWATVGGGYQNNSSGIGSTVAGGRFNQSTGNYATVAGGSDNISSGVYATAAGGNQNIASNNYATVPGGVGNTAGGQFSFAAGHDAKALHDGAFVWADSPAGGFASTGNNQFCIKARGGIQIDQSTSQFFGFQTRQMLNLYGTSYGIGVQAATMYFRCDASTGDSFAGFRWYRGGTHDDANGNAGGGTELMSLGSTYLYVNGTFVSSSDRNLKENFAPVQPREVLEKVIALPITRWNYKSDAATPHLGPVAQDFHAAFGIGPDDKHIATVDESGVALAAIQGLNQKVEEQRTENAELKRDLGELKQLVRQLSGQRER